MIATAAFRRRRSVAGFVLAAGLCLLPAVAGAGQKPRPPGAAEAPPIDTVKGYGPAPFGTRWDKAQKLFPRAEVLPENKNVGAASVGGPFVHRLYLTDQHVEGLPKPVNVELRFWKKNLWVVQVYWGDNSDQDVVAMLTRRLGPNQGNDTVNLLWIGDTVQVTGSTKQHTYGSADLALSADAQAWFKKLMHGEWKAPSQAELDEMEGRTPAATPAAR
ncbi:MAG TPA: hypothetical protein VL049_11395 [Candidatus Dormibacteraeota bacterium]|nr:hypothetical protein [Candidatus Dormibacteraeota bacterium]